VIVFRTLSIFVTAYGDLKLLQAKALTFPAVCPSPFPPLKKK